MQTTQDRTAISRQEFDKKVDIAFGYMTYMDRLKPEEARQKALEEVSEKYVVKDE